MWALGLKPQYETEYEGIEADLFWHSHRCKIIARPHERRYCKKALRVLTFSDIIDNTTNRIFNWRYWRNLVEQYETEKTGITPSVREIIKKADWIISCIRQIPHNLIRELKANLRKQEDVPVGGYGYLTMEDKEPIPVQKRADGKYNKIWIDALSVGHITGKRRTISSRAETPAVMWRDSGKRTEEGKHMQSASTWPWSTYPVFLLQMSLTAARCGDE